tara:strand:+ start:417 stop:863 length:447 start_codon:yes stop_codon:yes gene_type:complete
MKRILALLTLFLSINLTYSQNIKFLEQISTISFWDIDDVMINGYGYRKMEVEQERTRKYAKIVDDNINSVIVISILNPKNSSTHTLDLSVGSDYSMDKFKSNLVEYGYLYQGKNDYDLLIYRNDKNNILISSVPNKVGATQIIFAPIE